MTNCTRISTALGCIGVMAMFSSVSAAPPSVDPTDDATMQRTAATPESDGAARVIGASVPECPHPVLFQQAPDQAYAGYSDMDPSGLSFETADSVQFASDVTIRSLRWWGVYDDNGAPPDDDFRLRAYEDIGGAPHPVPFAEFYLSPVRVDNGTTNLGYTEYGYVASLGGGLSLDAGTTYWIAIVNNTPGDTSRQWAWSSGAGANIVRAFRVTGMGWNINALYSMSLELCGDDSAAACRTDFNGDNIIDGEDLAAVLAAWGPCDPPPDALIAPARTAALTDTSDRGTVAPR